MMSLEATRYLWAARLDPQRRTYAVGAYAHVLDHWGILYDQPIVLNRRQAGPAIEGALRQQHVDRLERVAVDTHGFTHFAMALAKLVGFDLCPRLARLKKRKLYLPRGLDVPEALRPCVAETVSRRAIGRGWEGLLRLGASVKHGWYPATEALDRFGSAAAGPVYEAGDGGWWPQSFLESAPPASIPTTVAIFGLLVRLISFIPVIRQITRLADPYFMTNDRGDLQISGFGARRITVAGTYLGALSVPSSSKPASRLTSSSNSSEVQPTTRKNSQLYTRQEIVNGVCNRRIDRIYPRIWWITLWKN
jgi:hypothetical protein